MNDFVNLLRDHDSTFKFFRHAVNYSKEIAKKDDSKSHVLIFLNGTKKDFPQNNLIAAEILTNTCGSDKYYTIPENHKEFGSFQSPDIIAMEHAQKKLMKVVILNSDKKTLLSALNSFNGKKLKFVFFGDINEKGELKASDAFITQNELKGVFSNDSKLFVIGKNAKKVNYIKNIRPFDKLDTLHKSKEFIDKNFKLAQSGESILDIEVNKSTIPDKLNDLADSVSFKEIRTYFKKSTMLSKDFKKKITDFWRAKNGSVLIIGVRGDCNLVKWKNEVYIIDIGMRNMGFFKVISFIFNNFIFKEKDTTPFHSFITHFHPDHISGFRRLMRFKEFLEKHPLNNPGKQKMCIKFIMDMITPIYSRTDTKKCNSKKSFLMKNKYPQKHVDTFDFKKRDIVMDYGPEDLEDENNNSVVLCFGKKIMICGDASITVIRSIIKRNFGGSIDLKFFLIPHHGSTPNWKENGKLDWSFFNKDMKADHIVFNCFNLNDQGRTRRSKTVKCVYKNTRKRGTQITVLEKSHLKENCDDIKNNLKEYHTYDCGVWVI